MKSSTRTIMTFIILILTTGSFAQTQNPPEQPEIKTFIISGSVGLAGVEMQGLPGDPVSNSDGSYSTIVPSGWSGTVTPTKRGYTFVPHSFTYHEVTIDKPGGNYMPKLITYTISGSVGVSDVIMEGIPGNPSTDSNGNYSATVDYGWSGTITPIKEGYRFEPSSRGYPGIIKSIHNQDYHPIPVKFKISGSVATEGAVMKGLPGLPITNKDGKYRASVEHGWSGTVIPIKEGYKFDPPYRQYDSLMADQDNQDYWPTKIDIAPMFEGSVSRRVLIVPTSDIEIENYEQTTEDMLVMLHIFDEKIKNEPDSIRGVFRNYGDFFGRDNKTSKAIYIQGYGVLFLLEVDLPLVFSPEPQPSQLEQTEEEDIDPVWQHAKEQVFSPKEDVPGMMSGSRSDDIQKRVEQLKNELIRTLKHASNIRHTEPDDWIILSVTGWSESTGRITPYNRDQMMENRADTRRRSRSGDRMGGGYAGGSYGGGGFSGEAFGGGSFSGGSFSAGSYSSGRFGDMEVREQTGISSAAVLTIIVKKSDVDDFAKDKIDFDEFHQKVQIFTY